MLLLLFLLYTSELFSILENKLIGYADDTTLMAIVLSPGVRVTVVDALIRDLIRVSEWCNLWGMKLNASKTKTMIVSMSCTMHPQSLPLKQTGGWQIAILISQTSISLCVIFYYLITCTVQSSPNIISKTNSYWYSLLVKPLRIFTGLVIQVHFHKTWYKNYLVYIAIQYINR